MRKIVQIVIGDKAGMFVLCDDGTVWSRVVMSGLIKKWVRVDTDDVVFGDEDAKA